MPPHKRGSALVGEGPMTRETRLAYAATSALEAHPEVREDDQWMILIDNPTLRHGGGTYHNLGSGIERIERILAHLTAMCEAENVDLQELLERIVSS